MSIATFSGVPSFTMFRTAVLRKSCRSIPGQPAFSTALAEVFRKSRGRVHAPARRGSEGMRARSTPLLQNIAAGGRPGATRDCPLLRIC